MSSSLAHRDYAVSKPAERPVIKKLVDNLQVSGGTLEAKPSLRTDYPEFQVKRPVIHRLNDQLKTSGHQTGEGEFTGTTLNRDQYRPFSVKRPEGGRKLRSSLKVRGHLDAVSTSRSQYQVSYMITNNKPKKSLTVHFTIGKTTKPINVLKCYSIKK